MDHTSYLPKHRDEATSTITFTAILRVDKNVRPDKALRQFINQNSKYIS